MTTYDEPGNSDLDELARESEFEAERKALDDRMRRINDLAASLLKKRDIAVKGRAASGVESRWREDEESFNGLESSSANFKKPMIDYATGEASPTRDADIVQSSVVVNLSRSKSETAHGRLCDILFPTDDRNWGCEITPIPEMADGLKDDRLAAHASTGSPVLKPDGQIARISEVAKKDYDEAKKRMTAMESEIDDQLTECGFNGECRKVAWDAIRLGTGVLKGPNVVRRVKKSWTKQEDVEGTAYILDVKEDRRPELRRVSPWNIFPDPDCSDDIKKAAYVWERGALLPRELVDLAMMGEKGGYLVDQIKQILDEEPVRINVGMSDSQQNKVQKTVAQAGGSYEVWTYSGSVNRDDMEAMGCECPEDEISPAVSASVVFVNDKPIKAIVNVLDSGDLPYDFFQWTPVSDSVWGIGIPRMMYWWDRILTGVMRAMLDNSRDSAGAAVIMRRGVKWGMTGKPRIGGKTMWFADDTIDDVRKVFAQFQIQNNQADLQKIIELVWRFIDMETSLPMLFQGENAKAPETLGATNIMVDANNIALRGRVKRWDDQITVPALNRMYDYNMQYNEREDIKGDFNVVGRGAAVLLARDSQTGALGQLFQLKDDPDVARIVDWDKALRTFMGNQHLDCVKDDDALKRDEEKAAEAAKQGGQQDPRIAGIQMRVQGDIEKTKMVQQSDMQELQQKQTEAEAQRAFDREMDERDKQFKLQMAVFERENKMMELSQASGISLDKIKAELSAVSMKLQTQKELSMLRGQGPQVATPPTEPVQHAPDGRAYQE